MKDAIKEWLKTYNHDRAWLAEQVNVKARTVDNWLSSPQEIPEGKQALIRRLMADDEAAEAARRQKLQPTAQIFSVEVDLPTFRSYSAAALAAGRTLEQWAIDELNAAAEASMGQSQGSSAAPSPAHKDAQGIASDIGAYMTSHPTSQGVVHILSGFNHPAPIAAEAAALKEMEAAMQRATDELIAAGKNLTPQQDDSQKAG